MSIPSQTKSLDDPSIAAQIQALALAGMAGLLPLSTGLGYATKAALDAALGLFSEGELADVTNDPTPANNGTWRKSGGAWVQASTNRLAVAEGKITALEALTSLTVNKGKDYPLKSMTRDGITSAASTVWNNLLLRIKVIGARADEYYQLSYMQNEANIAGNTDFGWRLKAFPIDTFATASAADDLRSHSDPAPNIDRAGGIQTIRLSTNREELWFEITLDAAALPAAGTPINSYSVNTKAGWSWVIDPDCYAVAEAAAFTQAVQAIDSLRVNQGKDYPLRPMVRDGLLSDASTIWNDLLLKLRVIGARDDEYYQLSYLQNEANISGNADFGWIVRAFSRDTFATVSAPTTLISHSAAAPEIDRAGGIQTITLTPASRPEMQFVITLDAAALPDAGTTIDSYTSSAKDAWSWIISPDCYELAIPAADPGAVGLYWSRSGAVLSLCWQSAGLLYRLRCGVNGHNNLPNIIGLDRAPLGDPATAIWTQIHSSTTDWLPPLTVQANAGGDAGSMIYTGGNHGADGGSGGAVTARNVLYQILIDNQPLAAGDGAGYAEAVTLLVQNELMAYNTITFPRYVLRQSFVVTIRPGSVEVTTEHRALEAITVKTDNGLQSVTTGFQDSQLFLGGQTTNRVAFDEDLDSGAKSGWPAAWAVILHDETNGQQVSWMDRSYEAGDGRYVDANSPLVRFGGSGNLKGYHAVVAAHNHVMAAGAVYKWRGGYAWQAPGLAPAGIDSTVAFHRDGKPCAALAITAADYTVLP